MASRRFPDPTVQHRRPCKCAERASVMDNLGLSLRTDDDRVSPMEVILKKRRRSSPNDRLGAEEEGVQRHAFSSKMAVQDQFLNQGERAFRDFGVELLLRACSSLTTEGLAS